MELEGGVPHPIADQCDQFVEFQRAGTTNVDRLIPQIVVSEHQPNRADHVGYVRRMDQYPRRSVQPSPAARDIAEERDSRRTARAVDSLRTQHRDRRWRAGERRPQCLLSGELGPFIRRAGGGRIRFAVRRRLATIAVHSG